MDDNKKMVKKTFFLYEYEKEEQYLTDMRAQGWKFRKIYKGMPTKYEFEKCEPKQVTYRLDYVTPDKDTDDYHQLLADFGWTEEGKYGTIKGNWYYFSKEGGDGQQRIYTDVDSKLHLMNVLWKCYGLFLFVCAFIELVAISMCLKVLSQGTVFSLIGVVALIEVVVFSGITAFIIGVIVNVLAAKKRLKNMKDGEI